MSDQEKNKKEGKKYILDYISTNRKTNPIYSNIEKKQ